MNTAFMLMAQYNGSAIIPLDRLCADYFQHLTPEKFQRKVQAGEIDLPIVRLEQSQKSARGIYLTDLATYLDAQRKAALADHNRLHGRA